VALLRNDGWRVNHNGVERIWRQERLKVPKRQPKRGRLRPTHRNRVWSYDFVTDRTHDGSPLKILTLIDEYSGECQAHLVERHIHIGRDDVLYCQADLFIRLVMPAHIRSDIGPELKAGMVRQWLEDIEVTTLFIEPGSPWENRHNDSFNGKLGDEVLNRKVFFTLEDANVVIENWRREYNTIRPHSSLNMRPPGTGVCLAVGLSTASAATKDLGIGFNSHLKAGKKLGAGHFMIRSLILE